MVGPLIFGIRALYQSGNPGAAPRPQNQTLGIYRDAVRSSRSEVVKASGLRWISLMWLGQVPWAGRYWALPVKGGEKMYRVGGSTGVFGLS